MILGMIIAKCKADGQLLRACYVKNKAGLEPAHTKRPQERSDSTKRELPRQSGNRT